MPWAWRVLGLCLVVGTATPALAASDRCEDAESVTALPFAQLSQTTCGLGDDFGNGAAGARVCPDLPGAYPGPDAVRRLVLGDGNRVSFTLTMPTNATGDLALFLVRQDSCADTPVCAGNSVDVIGTGLGPERIKTPPASYPAGVYSIIVDSADGSCGTYDLAVEGEPGAHCGNGRVEGTEVCDDGNRLSGDCCAADCSARATAGTVCRAGAGACDAEEVCDGQRDTCPADGVSGAGTPCRTAAGVCDVAESCDGLLPTCPPDRFATTDVACRAAAGPCDVTERCSGTAATCPADHVSPAGRICRGASGACDEVEVCDGRSGVCPADAPKPAGTECRARMSICEVPAFCTGSSFVCPATLPRSCDDNDPCTADRCDINLGCLHSALVCTAADAGVVGPPPPPGPDGGASIRPQDAAVNGEADANVGPPPVQPGDGAPPVFVDAAGDAARQVTTSADASRPDLGAGVDTAAAAVPDGGGDSANAGTSGDANPVVMPTKVPDLQATDAAEKTGGDGGGDKMFVAANSSGCSCDLGGAGESALGLTAPLSLVFAAVIRRRRSRVSRTR